MTQLPIYITFDELQIVAILPPFNILTRAQISTPIGDTNCLLLWSNTLLRDTMTQWLEFTKENKFKFNEEHRIFGTEIYIDGYDLVTYELSAIELTFNADINNLIILLSPS
jgi:hypothetical protein